MSADDLVSELRAEIEVFEGAREIYAEHLANGGTPEQWIAYVEAFMEEIRGGGGA